MTSKRAYFVLLGLLGLLFVGLLGGAYGANYLLSQQAQSLTTLKAKSSALSQEQTALIKAKAQVKEYTSLNQTINEIVPQQKNQAQAVAEIVDIANRNNIALGSITFPASTLGTATAVPTAASGTAATNNAAANAANNPNSKASKLSQLVPVLTIPGVYYSEIMVQGDPTTSVAYSQFITFLSDLEHNRGTALINAVSIQPDQKNPGNITFSLTMDEYVKP
jgi:hypothetical protein